LPVGDSSSLPPRRSRLFFSLVAAEAPGALASVSTAAAAKRNVLVPDSHGEVFLSCDDVARLEPPGGY